MKGNVFTRLAKLEQLSKVKYTDAVLFADETHLKLEGTKTHLRFKDIDAMNNYIRQLDGVVVFWNDNNILD